MGGGEIAAIKVITLELVMSPDGIAVALTTAVGAPLLDLLLLDPLLLDAPDAAGADVVDDSSSSDELPQATATSMTKASNANTTIGRLEKRDLFMSFVLLGGVFGSMGPI